MSSYRVELARHAVKALTAQPRQEQQRIRAAIDLLADNPRPPASTKLARDDHVYRVGVGNYRVIYEVHDDHLVIQVVRIGHRRDVCEQ